VLVSRAVVDAAQGRDIGFEEIGPVELKGVAGAIELFAVRGR
jgi:class 3 adenylate cyclase